MNPPLIGLILAGGRSTRMAGRNKALLELGGQTLLAHALARLAPQCAAVIVSANDEAISLQTAGLPIVADPLAGQAGPLAGVLAGLDWTANNAPGAALVSVPIDGPFFPDDLCARLSSAAIAQRTAIACAASGGRRHGVYSLFSTALRDDLRAAVITEGLRKVDRWLDRHEPAVVEWPANPIDPFFNINTPDDLAQAESWMTPRDELTAASTTLDLRGLKCPLPALRTRKALAALRSGEVLTVECTDPLAAIDIPHLVLQSGDVVEQQSRHSDVLVFRIRKAG